MYVVHDEINEVDNKNSITMFVQQASKKVAVRQMSVMFRKCYSSDSGGLPEEHPVCQTT